MRTLLAIALVLPATFAGLASASLGEQCDPTGNVCVVDAFYGRSDCSGEGYTGVDGVSLRHDSANGGAAAWTTCSVASGRMDRVNAVAVALNAAEVHSKTQWQSEDGDSAHKRWVLVWFQNHMLGDARADWYAHDGVGCYLLLDAKPLYMTHVGQSPGCLAGGPLAPPSTQWGRLLP